MERNLIGMVLVLLLLNLTSQKVFGCGREVVVNLTDGNTNSLLNQSLPLYLQLGAISHGPVGGNNFNPNNLAFQPLSPNVNQWTQTDGSILSGFDITRVSGSTGTWTNSDVSVGFNPLTASNAERMSYISVASGPVDWRVDLPTTGAGSGYYDNGLLVVILAHPPNIPSLFSGGTPPTSWDQQWSMWNGATQIGVTKSISPTLDLGPIGNAYGADDTLWFEIPAGYSSFTMKGRSVGDTNPYFYEGFVFIDRGPNTMLNPMYDWFMGDESAFDQTSTVPEPSSATFGLLILFLGSTYFLRSRGKNSKERYRSNS